MRLVMTLIFLCISVMMYGYVDGGDDSELRIQKEGNLVSVVDFKEGDKIKLFEEATGEHVLSKTRGQIDMSQLPVGTYVLENSEGKSVVIHKRALVRIVHATLGTDHMVDRDGPNTPKHLNAAKDLENYYIKKEGRLLGTQRAGDIVTVTDFTEGDTIKLFELKDKVHVISKTSEQIDLRQLPVGVYLLENSRGKSVVIEKSKPTPLFQSEIKTQKFIAQKNDTIRNEITSN